MSNAKSNEQAVGGTFMHEGHALTKAGLSFPRPSHETKTIETESELAEMYSLILGTHIHAGAAELARRKMYSENNTLPLPANVNEAYFSLAGNPRHSDELSTEDISKRIAKTLSNPNESTQQHLRTIFTWADTVHSFKRPKLKIDRSLSFQELEKYEQMRLFYALSIVELANDSILHDHNIFILPEISVNPETTNISRVLNMLTNDIQAELRLDPLRIDSLDKTYIFDEIHFNDDILRSESKVTDIFDLIFRYQDDPFQVLLNTATVQTCRITSGILGEDIPPDRIDVLHETDTIEITMKFQDMPEDQFIEYANELQMSGTILTEDMGALMSIYILCRAQAEFQYLFGENASLSEISTMDEFYQVLRMAKKKITDFSEPPSEASEVFEHHIVIPSGQIDYLLIQFQPDSDYPDSDQNRLYFSLLYKIRDLYSQTSRPSLHDSELFMILDQISAYETSTITIGDYKTSIHPRVTDEAKARHKKEMDFYMMLFLQHIYARRSTTHRLTGPKDHYILDDLTTDPIALKLTPPEIDHITGIHKGSDTFPNLRADSIYDHVSLSDLVQSLTKKHKQVSQAEQILKH